MSDLPINQRLAAVEFVERVKSILGADKDAPLDDIVWKIQGLVDDRERYEILLTAIRKIARTSCNMRDVADAALGKVEGVGAWAVGEESES